MVAFLKYLPHVRRAAVLPSLSERVGDASWMRGVSQCKKLIEVRYFPQRCLLRITPLLQALCR